MSLLRERVFVEPPWDEPLDPSAVLRAIPDSSTIAGMYLSAVLEGAEQRGKSLPSARDRYVPFRFYPLREHVQLLIEAAAAFFPSRPLRASLRSLGRAAPAALLRSTLGRVLLGSTQGVLEAVVSIVKTYPVNVHPSEAELMESGDGYAVVRLAQVAFFLDSHHVGVLEGTMRYAGAEGHVRVCTMGPEEALFHLTWQPPQPRRAR